MKFCYWTNYPNGHHRVFFEALRAQGHELHVCYFQHYDAYRLSMGWGAEGEYAPWEHFVCTPQEADAQIPDLASYHHVVTSFYNWTHWRVIAYCVRRHLPWSAVLEPSRGSWKTAIHRWLLVRLLNWTGSRLFAISSLAMSCYQRLGIDPKKLIHHAHSTPPCQTPPPIRSPKTPYQGITYLFCGIQIPRKGVDILLAAFARVHATHPTSRLLLTGPPPETGEPAGTHYVGYVAPEQIDTLMRQADVIVLPSRFDGWGMTLPEGARNALAMIGTDQVGSALDLIEQGISGYVVSAQSVDALAEAMLIYASHPHLAYRHGQAALTGATFAQPATCARRFAAAFGQASLPL